MARRGSTECSLSAESPHFFVADHPKKQREPKVLADKSATLTTGRFSTALMLAVKSRSLMCCKFLVGVGIKPDATDSKGRTAAMMAVLSESLECLQVLVKAGAKLDVRDSEGKTAAILAAQSGSLECLQVLVKAGARLDITDSEGRTAFILAAQTGSVECLQYLISVGSNVEMLDRGYLSLLLTAIKFQQSDCLRVLLQAGFDPNKAYDCKIPLIMATLTENVECLRDLIHAGADLDKTNCEANKALMFAARYGKYEHVKVLVEAGANPNMDNLKGETALMMAVESNSLQCIRYLIHKGADVNAHSLHYNTALMFATRHAEYEHIKMLVEAGADINADNIRGETALMMAADCNSLQCVSYLIQKEADVNTRSSEGKTALMFAACHGKYEHIKILVEAGAEINVETIRGETALMMAVESDSLQCVSYLIHKGADVSACSSSGLTTVRPALLNRNTDIITLLLQAPEARGLLACMGYQDWRLFLKRFLLGGDGCRLHKPLNNLFRSLVSSFAVTDVNVQHVERKIVLLHLLLSSMDAHEASHTSASQGTDGQGSSRPVTDAYINWFGACVKVLMYTDRVNFEDNNGRTALWHAAHAGQHCLPLLIELGAKIDHFDSWGESVFMVAISRADSVQIHQLIMGGADLNAKNKEGDTPPVYALKVLSGRQFQAISSECQLMLCRGVDVNIRNDYGATPLMVAVRNPGCSFEMLELMLVKGADVHALDKYGHSVLVHAVQSRCDRENKLDRVTWLLQRGVEPLLPDIRSLTRVLGGRPSNKYSVTRQNINELIREGRTEIIRLLVSHGVFPAPSDPSSRYQAGQNAEVTSGQRRVAGQIKKQEDLFPPFIFALINKRLDIAKYFVVNLYLTQADMTYRVDSDLDSFLDQEERRFLSNVHSRPWSLVNLALIALSDRLGPGVHREYRVVETGLSEPLRHILMFQTPMAKLSVNELKNISLSFLWETRPHPSSPAMLAPVSQ